MEIRVTTKGGSARVETISILEDLWHDLRTQPGFRRAEFEDR
jgi:hypothetical protein